MEVTAAPKTVSKPGSPGAVAWQLMYEIFRASKPYMATVAGAFDLTVQQLFALKQLGRNRPIAMSELASTLGCDASNVTSLVDKLESRGLVERRSADHDRRVKALLLTEAGVAIQDGIEARMQQPPPAIDNLTASDQHAMCVLLQRALDSLG